MRLGIYVGSFNPVHKGHKHVMEYILDNQYVDKVIVIATGNYWDKVDMISIQDRINMLSFYEKENIIINRDLNAIPFTYQVLENLQKQYPNDQLYLIIGADNLPKFHLWKQVNTILKHHILVLQRNDMNMDTYIQNFKQKNQFIMVKDFQYFNISSTEIRKAIELGNVKNLETYLDKDILEYIIKNGLYQRRKEK